MRQERERGAVEEYIRGYVQQPEGKDEHALTAASHHVEFLEYEERGQGAG